MGLLDLKKTGIAGAIIFIWVLIGVFGIALVKNLSALLKNPHSVSAVDIDPAQRIVREALACSLTVNPVLFKGTSDSVFLSADAKPRIKRSFVKPARTQPPPFTLKGLLLRNVPLAILENSKGETFIRGIGDTVYGEIITKIENNGIQLRNGSGVYDLPVAP
jgi:hypothetical protein